MKFIVIQDYLKEPEKFQSNFTPKGTKKSMDKNPS